MKRLRIDEPHQQTTTTIKETISQDRLLSSSVAHVTPSTPQIVATANLPLNALGGSVGISGIQQYHQQQRQPILHHPITQSYKIISEGGGGSSSSGSVNSGASAAVTVISSGGSSSMQSGLYQSAPTSVNFGAMPSATVPHSVATRPSPSAIQPSIVGPASAGANREQTCTVVRANSTTGSPPNSAMLDPSQPPQQQSPASSFHRLKVEDALSYLDLVKYKFGSKPQVYNDFLDIMKEFKSQSIDTPGVIQRVSNLFKGFPDLIVGFNTFLPPGYKIEVQKNDQGYAFQVSVSMPSPTGGSAIVNSTEMQHHSHHHPQPQPTTTTPRSTMILKGAGTINLSGGGGGGGVTQGNSVVASAPPPSSIPALHHSQQQQQVVAVTAPSAQTLSLAQQQQHMPPVAPQSTPLSTPVVHHSSSYGSSAPAYGSLSMSAAVTHALQGHTDTPQNQPVEFNHAINYVNKIKNRFQGQPEKYKKFLEILHTYQKEQRTLKESGAAGSNVLGGKHLTEQEVYSQVAKLFENQSDLLAEFGQFLPDATSHMNQAPIADHNSVKKPTNVKPSTYHHHRNSGGDLLDRHNIIHKQSHVSSGPVKRSPTYPTYHRDAPPPKKHKLSASASCRDVTLSEAGKFGTLNDYAFFDKVRKAVRTQEVYNNFLRCLTLFNQEIVSKSELIAMVTPFLSKFPELLRWFREFMGQNETAEPVPYNVARTERPQGDHALEIDLATAKRLGASYCIIPKAQEGLRCSGRTQLCKEVLNDQWVSFPTWSEDSTFVSSRKTQYEEYMYRCEDERFELDVVIETNATTIRVLEGVNKKLSRMSQEEVAKFKLDDCLGGSSPTLHQRALKRIYGDKAQDIIDGLKRNPAVAVPVVLRRLKAKEEEWREAQKGFNKIWREQNEKYYLKSLDHQGINFKQTDVKALRSKSLFNEIETLFDERHEQNEEASGEPTVGPHLILPYKDRTILDDATNLLIHHVKRHTGIQKGEKQRIKQLLRQFLPDLFFYPRQQLSDDEREDDDEKDEDEESSNSSPRDGDSKKTRQSPGKSPARAGQGTSPLNDSVDMMDIKMEVKEEDPNNVPLHAQTNDPEEAYTLFMANNNWYIFLRLHAILCERLAKIYERACILAAEEAKSRHNRKESTAIALRLKPKPQIEIEDYYPAFLDMVKNLLDGNMEANTFEDTLREMFGIHAYIAFTLDKVVSYAVRQLQHCVTERTAIACTELFLKEQKRGAAGGPCETAYKRYHMELAYQRAGERAVQDESCFKIYIYKKDCKMTIELLDTEQEDTNKKVEENKKWSSYKENYSDCTSTNNNLLENRKVRSPVYLSRNLRLYKRKALNNQKKQQQQEGSCEKASDSATSSNGENDKFNMIKELERKLNEKAMPERSTSENIGGYQVNDEQECKFNLDAKILFTVNKDSCLYKMSAFQRAKKTHPQVTKRKGCRFRAWLKKWASANVSDNQSKSCTDWMMGRCEGVVANRTRVVTDNDLTRSPYVPYNRYRVERLHTTTTNTTTSSNNSAPSLALPPTSSIVAITPTTGVSAIAATPSASAATSSTTVDAEHSSSSSSSSPPSSSPTISSSTTTS